MKRIILLAISSLTSWCIYAQDEEKNVRLDEITVKGAEVVSKVDGQTIYPNNTQKSSSNNGYSILQKLSLPNIRIDDANHSIYAIDDRGNVQIRINGIVAGKEEMLALNPKRINKIDFIDNPGVRYGDDIAYVINIITKGDDNGYTIGTDLTPTLTSQEGNGIVYGKRNTGKSEISASYDFSGQKKDGEKTKETTDYTMNDGSIRTIKRNDTETLYKDKTHCIKLTYNLADSTAHVFQISLSGNTGNIPVDRSIKKIEEGESEYNATYKNSRSSISPVIDIYLFEQIGKLQSITANIVGTHIKTNTNNYFNEISEYQYDVKGKTASIISEVVYENKLKPFTLSTGVDYRYKWTKNNYIGNASFLTEMNKSYVYAFGEIKGAFGDMRYSLGIGASHINYSQNKHKYDFWTACPKMSIAYKLGHGTQMKYTLKMSDRASRIAMTNEATIKTNSMEYTVGNPELRPTRDTENSLRLSYNTSRWKTFVDAFHRHCEKPNMAHYERTDDDRFIYTQINQKEIDLLRLAAYASYWIVPEKVEASVYSGMQRCFNYGNDYSHFYTSWFYMSDITAYLGRFTLRAYRDNGNRFLEGETRVETGAYTAMQTSYQYNDWQFTLTWANPFTKNHKSYEGEIINSNLHKQTAIYDKESGNSLTLNISWRMSRGKRHQSADKTINLRDTEDGIMK